MRCLTLILGLVAGSAGAEAPRVVADIAPVQSLVAMVTGELASPGVLLDPAADPHSFQLRPSQARLLAGADLLVWMGPELTPWLDRALAATAPQAASLALLQADHPPQLIEGKVVHFADPAKPPGEDTHAHGALDPHAWLDPLNAAFYLGLIAAELARLDPPNSAVYVANAEAAAQALEQLHDELAPRMQRLGHAVLIAGHDAFSYLLFRYNLRLTGTLSDSAGNAAGVARLRALHDDLTENGSHTCLLLEPGAPADLAEGLDLAEPPRVAVLDPMGAGLPPGAGLYPAMMRRLADGLASCAAPEG